MAVNAFLTSLPDGPKAELEEGKSCLSFVQTCLARSDPENAAAEIAYQFDTRFEGMKVATERLQAQCDKLKKAYSKALLANATHDREQSKALQILADCSEAVRKEGAKGNHAKLKILDLFVAHPDIESHLLEILTQPTEADTVKDPDTASKPMAAHASINSLRWETSRRPPLQKTDSEKPTRNRRMFSSTTTRARPFTGIALY